MKMLRHYFISDSLDDLEVIEKQLEASGISTPQIHVLSRNDAEVEHHHHLHEVQSFMKRDIVHSTLRGALVGLCAFLLVPSVAYYAGWTDTAAGWLPFLFLAGGWIARNRKTEPQLRPFRTGAKRRQTYLFRGSRTRPGSGIGVVAQISSSARTGRNRIIRPALADHPAAKNGDDSPYLNVHGPCRNVFLVLLESGTECRSCARTRDRTQGSGARNPSGTRQCRISTAPTTCAAQAPRLLPRRICHGSRTCSPLQVRRFPEAPSAKAAVPEWRTTKPVAPRPCA